MTSPKLATTNDDGQRRYLNPLTGRDDFVSVTSILRLLPNNFHKIPPDILERAGRRGEFVHQLFEHGTTCATDIIPPLDIPEAAQDMASACAFMDEWNPHILHQELTVFNERLGYAGTLDMIADFGGSIGVVLADVKTSRDISAHVPYQLAAYAEAEYAMIEVDGEWQRIIPPDYDNYVIIYIRGDQHELVPITVTDQTRKQWRGLVAAHRLINDMHDAGADAINRPVPPPSSTVFDERIAVLRERIKHLDNPATEALRDALIARGIKLSTATEHTELDQVETLITAADENYGAVPESWDKAAVKHFGEQFKALPSDLMIQVEAMTKRYGVPNLGNPAVRQHHIDYALQQLSDAMDIQDERYMQIVKVATEHLPGDTGTGFTGILAIIAREASKSRPSGPTDEYILLQELETRRAIALIEAIGEGLIDIHDGAIVTVDSTLADLVARAGSKSALLDSGRSAADEMQVERPRSSADVAASPLLAACAAASLDGAA